MRGAKRKISFANTALHDLAKQILLKTLRNYKHRLTRQSRTECIHTNRQFHKRLQRPMVDKVSRLRPQIAGKISPMLPQMSQDVRECSWYIEIVHLRHLFDFSVAEIHKPMAAWFPRYLWESCPKRWMF